MSAVCRKTVIDYYALPGEIRTELIDGDFYEVPRRGTLHQDIASYLHIVIGRYIFEQGLDLKLYEGSVSVMVACDDYNMVEPDLMIVSDKSMIGGLEIYGAPDFIAEIVSDGTRKRDLISKVKLYKDSGVKEYWVIDPAAGNLYKYIFMEGKDEPEVFDLECSVTVSIFDNRLSVDLSGIRDIIDEHNRIPV
ncbi:Uma2 family endonuclease [Butyrivibrio sp. MB2005]|uniref:Uma2 family endonuclease n=1 Tax=Butyrivibrio sp. MB2005 TaxID=1280678 RepID=UPI000402F890|nr:Uma2 family endonuclease [Butyrivibrio sp. MB2005]